MSHAPSHVLFTEQQIAGFVREVAKKISRDYKNREVILIGILDGAAPFTSDLAREIERIGQVKACIVTFMNVSTYPKGSRKAGLPGLLYGVQVEIAGRDLIIVDDIGDTFITMETVIGLLQTRRPKSIRTCVLLAKPDKKRAGVRLHYCGARVSGDPWVYGYGMDLDEKLRGLPFIAVEEPPDLLAQAA